MQRFCIFQSSFDRALRKINHDSRHCTMHFESSFTLIGVTCYFSCLIINLFQSLFAWLFFFFCRNDTRTSINRVLLLYALGFIDRKKKKKKRKDETSTLCMVTKVLNQDNFRVKKYLDEILSYCWLSFFLSFQFLVKSIDLHYLKLKLDINKIY